MKKLFLPLGLFILFGALNTVNAQTLAEHITELSKTDTVTMSTNDPDHNIRYIGANPNNYVEFNNETWRIIGVFDGKIKLIRKDSIGSYSFDLIGTTYDDATGHNDYSKSKLMQELNGDYLNYNLSENTQWYSRVPKRITAAFDYTKTIKKDAQEMIVDSVWHINSVNIVDGQPTSDKKLLTAEIVYNNEYHSLTDKTWIGKVGLINTSDYLYQTAGGENTSREKCLNTGYWRQMTECSQNSWFAFAWMWAINQYEYENGDHYASSPAHALEGNDVTASQVVYPVVFLNSQVYSTSGTGSKNDPYKLNLYHEVELINGDETTTVKVEHDTKLSKPDIKLEKDYTLTWYEDSDFKKEYDFNSLIESDKKLYGKLKFNYKITSGADQKHKISDDDIVITTNGKLENLVGIKVNGVLLASSNYKLEKGSTILTLNHEYLNSLNNDTYYIEFVYNDDSIGTHFTIEGKKVMNPKTYDSILKYVSIFVISLIALVICYKNKKNC